MKLGASIMRIHVMNLCMLATPFDLLCVTVTPLMLQVTDWFYRQVNMLLLGQGIKCERPSSARARQPWRARPGLRESEFELSCTAPMAVLEHSLGAWLASGRFYGIDNNGCGEHGGQHGRPLGA